MNSKVYPLLLIILGTLLLIYNFVDFSINYIMIITPGIIVLVIFIFSQLIRKNKILGNIMLQNNTYETNVDEQKTFGIIAKISGKIELDKNQVNFQKELEALMETLSRRESGFEYYVLTSLSKKRSSSVLLIQATCESCKDKIIEEFRNVQDIARAVSPHISLEVVRPSNKIVPVPRTWGDLSYAKVFQKIIDTPSNEHVIYDYDIEIGSMRTDAGEIRVGIRLQDLTRHIGIFGTTGSGKSTTALSLIKKLLEKNIKILVIDWHGEYKEKINTLNVFSEENPLIINPIALGEIEDTVEILGDVLHLSDPQRFLLHTTLSRMKKINKFDNKTFFSILKSIEESSNWIREVKYGLLRKIYLLFTRQARIIFGEKANFRIETILNSIIDLSFIKNVRLRRIYGLFVIKLVTDYYMSNKPNEPLLVIVEEAHNFFFKENLFLDKLLSEIRKYGVALCVISQSPSSITDEVLKNTNIKIVHSIKSDLDKRIIADSLSLSHWQFDILDKLETGEAILSAPNIKTPIVVKIQN